MYVHILQTVVLDLADPLFMLPPLPTAPPRPAPQADMQQKLAARALPQMQVDVVENDKGYTLSANLPGVKKSEIAIDVDREAGTIRISAHRIARERSDDERWHRRERQRRAALAAPPLQRIS